LASPNEKAKTSAIAICFMVNPSYATPTYRVLRALQASTNGFSASKTAFQANVAI
jgi:hypothetical protein